MISCISLEVNGKVRVNKNSVYIVLQLLQRMMIWHLFTFSQVMGKIVEVKKKRILTMHHNICKKWIRLHYSQDLLPHLVAGTALKLAIRDTD